VAFAVLEQIGTGVGNRAVMPDCGHGVLQRPTSPHMHVHVARGHEGHPKFLAQRHECRPLALIVALTMQLHRDPAAVIEDRLQPGALLLRFVRIRDPERKHPLGPAVEVGAVKHVAPLPGTPSCLGDKRADPLIADQILSQQHQPSAID